MDGLQMDTVTVASMAARYMDGQIEYSRRPFMDRPGKTIGNIVSDT